MDISKEIKQEIQALAQVKIQEKLSSYQFQIDEIKKSISEDTKSSAGDKHNTSRSMAQLELEKLGKSYAEVLKQKEIMERISSDQKQSENIQLGSLILTEKTLIYLGPSLGAFDFKGSELFCISSISPLGKQVLGKKKGDVIPFNQAKILDFI